MSSLVGIKVRLKMLRWFFNVTKIPKPHCLLLNTAPLPRQVADDQVVLVDIREHVSDSPIPSSSGISSSFITARIVVRVPESFQHKS